MLRKETLLQKNSGQKWYYYISYSYKYEASGAILFLDVARAAKHRLLQSSGEVLFPSDGDVFTKGEILNVSDFGTDANGWFYAKVDDPSKLPMDGAYSAEVSGVSENCNIRINGNEIATDAGYEWQNHVIYTTEPVGSRGGL